MVWKGHLLERYFLPGHMPWFVTSRVADRGWYIANIITGKARKIGPIQHTRRNLGCGINYMSRAKELAKQRNEDFFSDVKKLPLYLGIHPELDALITEKLKGGSSYDSDKGSHNQQ